MKGAVKSCAESYCKSFPIIKTGTSLKENHTLLEPYATSLHNYFSVSTYTDHTLLPKSG